MRVVDRHHIGTVVTAAAALLAGSLSLNPIVTGVVNSIGVDLLSNQILEAVNAACQHLGSSYILNDDIQNAWQRAFRCTIKYLERTYKDSPHYQQSTDQEFIEQVFDDLLQDGDTFFTSINQDQDTQTVLALLQKNQSIQTTLSRYLNDYLCDADDHLRDFVKQHLVELLARFFIEELKINDGAWKEYQLLAHERFQDSLKQLQADSQEARTLLQELPERWEQFSRKALDEVARDLTAKIDAQFATTQAIVHEESSQTRNHTSKEADRVIEAIRKKRGKYLFGFEEFTLDEGMLALLNLQKEQCQRKNVAVNTAHLLLALLEIRNGVAQRAFDALKKPDLDATTLHSRLEQYIVQYPSMSDVKPYPKNFQWEDLPAVQKAWQWAQKDGGRKVTEKHLLLGILEAEDSGTLQSLRRRLGDDLHRLVQIVQDTPNEALGPLGTPWIEKYL